MASNDYAIVVAINRYPGLAGPPPSAANLEGPENDADAIIAWLQSPSGGNVPEANIRSVKSTDFPTPATYLDALPNPSSIEKCFSWLQYLAEENSRVGKGERVGRRLYIYMAGHGFSPSRYQGCVFAANATATQAYNVFTSGWLEWFMDNLYFDEFVLWMDCCMDREFTVVPGSIPFRKQGGFSRPGPTFIAFAAPRPLKAAEHAFGADNGGVHGVFTWTLLQGLKGAAADPRSKSITARSLSDYLRNAMRVNLLPAELEDLNYSEEPEIVKDDPGLILVTEVQKIEQLVKLKIPANAVGLKLRLYGSEGHHLLDTETGILKLELPSGLYVADFPSLDLRAGFEIVQNTDVNLKLEKPVHGTKRENTSRLTVWAQDPTAEIVLIDAQFKLVAREMRSLVRQNIATGVYKIRVKSGRRVTERIVLIDSDVDLTIEPLPIVTAAPIEDTASTHEYHIAGMRGIGGVPSVGHGIGAELRIMSRVWSPKGQSNVTPPWRDMTICDENGQVITDLSSGRVEYIDLDPFVRQRLTVEPGAYFARQSFPNGRECEQTLIATRGWSSSMFLMRLAGSALAESGAGLALRRTVFMAKLGEEPGRIPGEETIIEKARIALADERSILNDELEALLLEKYENPIAGIIGAHLFILEVDRGNRRDLDLLNIVVTNLRKLVGPSHPDVEALSLRCSNQRLQTRQPVNIPPMFFRSWKLLIDASGQRPELVPVTLWNRVCAATNSGGFLVWFIDEQTRNAQREQWKKWVYNLRKPKIMNTTRLAGLETTNKALSPLPYVPDPDAAAEAAVAAGVPLAAFNEMWQGLE